MRLSTVAAACAVLLPLPAGAAVDPATVLPVNAGGISFSNPRPIPSQVAPQPGPVRIDVCSSDGRGGQGLTIVHHALRITNTGDRAIIGVRVRFAFYDAFGDVETSRTNIVQSRIEPGQTADRINVAELADAGPPAKIACSVDAVRYVDGTLSKSGS